MFDFQSPENRCELGIILNDFGKSTISVTQIQVSFPGVEIVKHPGIQPNYFSTFIGFKWYKETI